MVRVQEMRSKHTSMDKGNQSKIMQIGINPNPLLYLGVWMEA